MMMTAHDNEDDDNDGDDIISILGFDYTYMH